MKLPLISFTLALFASAATAADLWEKPTVPRAPQATNDGSINFSTTIGISKTQLSRATSTPAVKFAFSDTMFDAAVESLEATVVASPVQVTKPMATNDGRIDHLPRREVAANPLVADTTFDDVEAPCATNDGRPLSPPLSIKIPHTKAGPTRRTVALGITCPTMSQVAGLLAVLALMSPTKLPVSYISPVMGFMTGRGMAAF
ncbi:hypothetical protein M406DRAFT_71814 [Cryphonectria parasitica EP155]|uniref:Uncharacterized protein n=1 Tax=Cryphonectria parasitica (strain ATCC 38755 / EP155) TaxID=660469 RepID=A0A9P5CSP5_CRYP1|nr:uncharacterized protein M406DRAFT_71814 [Cryphonectria parasitica EP155]KAF3768842.1 hypothetical protein M406DRAFT_71814 [Cryphonectria parasitica EP155]